MTNKELCEMVYGRLISIDEMLDGWKLEKEKGE